MENNNRALLIIDVQNDYFKGGSMELVGTEEAAKNCQLLLEHFRSKNLPVYHVQHFSAQEGATFFLPNTEGAEIHPLVKPKENETLVQKNYPSAFRDTELDNILKKAGIKELVIVGAMTHMCIDTSTRAAFDLGYSCQVISDACATRDLEWNGTVVKSTDVQAAYLAALGWCFAKILTTQDYLK